MKKWVDADKIIRMVTYLEDPELRELEIQMQENRILITLQIMMITRKRGVWLKIGNKIRMVIPSLSYKMLPRF